MSFYGFTRKQALLLLDSRRARVRYLTLAAVQGIAWGAGIGFILTLGLKGWKEILYTEGGLVGLFSYTLMGAIIGSLTFWASHTEQIQKLQRARHDAEAYNRLVHTE